MTWAIPALSAWRAENRAEINGRGEAVREVFQRLPGWRLASLGAYFAYVQLPFMGVEAARVAERLGPERTPAPRLRRCGQGRDRAPRGSTTGHKDGQG